MSGGVGVRGVSRTLSESAEAGVIDEDEGGPMKTMVMSHTHQPQVT